MSKPIQVAKWTGKQLGDIAEWLYGFPSVRLVQMTIKKELMIELENKKLVTVLPNEYICVNTDVKGSIIALTEEQAKNCLVDLEKGETNE